MREQAGRVFQIGAEHRPVPGCTMSYPVHHTAGLDVSYFALAAHTDISAESYAYPKLLVVATGSLTAYTDSGRTWSLEAGASLVMPTDTPVGIRTQDGCVYAEIAVGRETIMNEAVRAGEVFRLGDLVPYQDGTIVNMDVAHNDAMKLAVMSFDAGAGLSEHAAPGEALVFALEGEGVIGYEGQEHVIHAGENFKFDRGGRHYVRADKRFKMALLLTLK